MQQNNSMLHTEKRCKYNVCTGKPSDSECISWSYENLDDAIVTATEFFNNYTNIKF